VYGRALAQTVGTAVMRMADADVLPYQFTDFADTIHEYIKQLQDLLKKKQDEATERDKELDEGLFQATYDPRHPTVAPPREEVPPFLNFAPMQNVADALTKAAERYEKALGSAGKNGQFAAGEAQLHDLNQKLIESERKLLDPAGLPRRPWYKHVLYAPGVYTGYSPKTVPGVREAIEQKRWQEADQQIAEVAKVLQGEVELINSAAEELEGWSGGAEKPAGK
jgi:N-acetylated-alpha-linked acidic dipeptidase